MAVRNFYVAADIDGRTTKLQGGPASKDGGMTVTLYQRRDGNIVEAVELHCFVNSDGNLQTTITVGHGLDDRITTREYIVTER
jgi:hypothetical protein